MQNVISAFVKTRKAEILIYYYILLYIWYIYIYGISATKNMSANGGNHRAGSDPFI